MAEYKIKELAELSNVTVRTLHHYDEIGILKPYKKQENGYRIYNDNSITRLQEILFLKEMDFDLEQIKKLLKQQNYDKNYVLKKQKNILVKKQERLTKIIKSIDKMLGGEVMENKEIFNNFDMSEIEEYKIKYSKETQEKWGNTDAYKECAEKTKNYTEDDWKRVQEQSGKAYQMFIEAMPEGATSEKAKLAVEEWIKSITDNFYTCTIEIARGLGNAYVNDSRFTKNINKFKEGLAEFMSEAIEYYCNSYK